MGNRQFTNNATTTLASSITATATSLTVAAGSGALFPSLETNQTFSSTLIKADTPTTYEIILVTARTTDTFTIVRAQQGTTALAWNAGDTVALLPTAGDFQQFTQFGDLQAQTGNFTIDTGSANAYLAAFTPALTAYSQGVPLRIQITHTNTGASTLNAGVSTLAIQYPGGAALAGGELQAGGTYTFFYTGSAFEVANPDYATLIVPIVSSSFTPGWTGFSSNPSGNVNYVTDGKRVTLDFSSLSVGTSNASTLTLTGLPESLIPIGDTYIYSQCTACDNAINFQPAVAQIPGASSGIGAGTIIFGISRVNTGTGVISNSYSGFTTSGSKSPQGTLLYLLTP